MGRDTLDSMVLEGLTAHARRLFLLEGDRTASMQMIEPLPGLRFLRHAQVTAFEASLYNPVVCLILEGKKVTTLGERVLSAEAGECLVVSHDLPVVSRVIRAPYLALLLDVDLELLSSVTADLADEAIAPAPPCALNVQRAVPALLEALSRYLALTSSKPDAKVLGPLLRKELHYRLLTAPLGGMLRQVLRHGSHAKAIAQAISHIRGDLSASIEVPALARRVGMSTSSFHKHFKLTTCSTPLQYQKHLRLLAARRLLMTGAATVSTAAYEVGYESPNQFSREYTREFGVPPSRDARVQRAVPLHT